MLNMAWHSSYTIMVCAAVEICKILLVLHNMLYVCDSMQLSSVLLLVVALPVTVWQPLNRAAGQWTHPRVRRSWPDARQNNVIK
jgi:hypothetical protein